uniref:Uncharacterized protein n=1 Tax=Meloidogyne incognita TaxID=6306 RepID=A0A914KY82_MELIC
MSTHDQVNVQLSANTSDNVFAKHDTCTPRTFHTALNTIFRIGPEQVELNCWVCRVEVRHRATEGAQLVQTSQTIRDSTDPPANQSSEWQPSERFVECYPERLSVVWESSADLLEEPIDTVDVATFMVAAQQEEICRISCLVGQKQDSCLDALTAAVDVICENLLERLIKKWLVLYLRERGSSSAVESQLERRCASGQKTVHGCHRTRPLADRSPQETVEHEELQWRYCTEL